MKMPGWCRPEYPRNIARIHLFALNPAHYHLFVYARLSSRVLFPNAVEVLGLTAPYHPRWTSPDRNESIISSAISYELDSAGKPCRTVAGVSFLVVVGP